MNETEIRKYAQIMREYGLTALKITEEGRELRLERAPSAREEAPSPVAEGYTAPPSPIETGYYSVKSPLVGVFYSSPAENADPYVAVGDRVKKGQTLCIIEAMKLLNEITAEEEGVISAICVTNGQMVEFGTELFHIARQYDE